MKRIMAAVMLSALALAAAACSSSSGSDHGGQSGKLRAIAERSTSSPAARPTTKRTRSANDRKYAYYRFLMKEDRDHMVSRARADAIAAQHCGDTEVQIRDLFESAAPVIEMGTQLQNLIDGGIVLHAYCDHTYAIYYRDMPKITGYDMTGAKVR